MTRPRAIAMPKKFDTPRPNPTPRLSAQERKTLHDEALPPPLPLLMAVSLPGEGDWRVYELHRDGSTFEALAAPDLLKSPAAMPHRTALAAVLSGTTRESRKIQAQEAVKRIEDFRERVSAYHFEVVREEIVGTRQDPKAVRPRALSNSTPR